MKSKTIYIVIFILVVILSVVLLLFNFSWKKEDEKIIDKKTINDTESWIEKDISLDEKNKKNWKEIENTEIADKEKKDKRINEVSRNLFEDYKNKRIENIYCSLILENDNYKQVQDVFISWELIRMDWKIISNENEIDTHTINDGKYLYTRWDNWAVKVPMDLKVYNPPNNIEDNNEANDMRNQTNIEDILTKLTYEQCKEWTFDKTKFMLPKWVKFEDISQFIDMFSDDSRNLDWDNNTSINLEEFEKAMGNMPEMLPWVMPYDSYKENN